MLAFRSGQWHCFIWDLPFVLSGKLNGKTTSRLESIFYFMFPQSCDHGKGYAPRLARPLCWGWKSPTICDCAILWLADDYVSRRLIGWDMRYVYSDSDDGVIVVIYGRHRRTRDMWWMRLTLHNNNNNNTMRLHLALRMGPDTAHSLLLICILL